jgi:hypothetical protein
LSSNRFIKVLNSRRLRRSTRVGQSGSSTRHAPRSNSIGTSLSIVARCLESLACSSCSFRRRFTRSGFTLSALSKISSKAPSACMSLTAVFSPIPGTPGILSDVSPANPLISGTYVGSTPRRSLTASTSYVSISLMPRFVTMARVSSDTSCRVSLSPVTIRLSTPASSACFVIVPIMSSASYPSISSTGMRKAERSSFMRGI